MLVSSLSVLSLTHFIIRNNSIYTECHQKMNNVHWPFKIKKIDIKCPISK